MGEDHSKLEREIELVKTMLEETKARLEKMILNELGTIEYNQGELSADIEKLAKGQAELDRKIEEGQVEFAEGQAKLERKIDKLLKNKNH